MTFKILALQAEMGRYPAKYAITECPVLRSLNRQLFQIYSLHQNEVYAIT